MHHCVCMVSDFFYPNIGGVESHIFQLSQCLLERGHKVIVVTHSYDDRVGIRLMTNLLKVYYLPLLPFYNQSILPTIIGSLPYLRSIFLAEKVNIVHGHSAFSSLAHEALFVASLLDIPSVFTDHSLFGFSDASAIVTNAFLRYSLANTSHIICVSHTGKENTVLRSNVEATNVSVISNAVDAVKFRPEYPEEGDGRHGDELPSGDSDARTSDNFWTPPDKKPTRLDADEISWRELELNGSGGPSTTTMKDRPKLFSDYGRVAGSEKRRFDKDTVTVVLGSRLVYRKGIDLVPDLLPALCKRPIKINGRNIQVYFIIAGAGPKRILIEEVIEKYKLQNRVTMLGELKHSDMRDKLLIKGDIFLNTSLTEAFCMAIVEAVACGLTVVSTGVGGIPEVLPPQFIYLVQPNHNSIIQGLRSAIEDLICGRRPSARECNRFVRSAYCWRELALRTQNVYNAISRKPKPTLAKKVRNLWECGPMAGPMMAVLYLACHYVIILLNWLCLINHPT